MTQFFWLLKSSFFSLHACIRFQDEKLEHVLGHFQKDFEGGVSAEKLGK
jgi:hypothetical protein